LSATATEGPPPAGRSLKERLVTGGIWVVLGKVVTAGSTVLVAALLTRLLPQDAVGVYFIADRLIWLTAMLALLGLNTAVVRLVAEALGQGRPGRARAAIRVVYRYGSAGVAGTAGFLAFGGGAWLALRVWDSPLLAAVIGAVAVWAAVHSLQILTSETFRGFQDLRLATVFGGVITGGLGVVVLALVWWLELQITLLQVVALIAAAGALSLLLALTLLARRVRSLGPAEPLASSEVLRISIPLWINALMAYVMTQSDVLILGMFRGDDEVAIYGAAARLVSLVLMTLMLVNLVVPPFISELYAKGQKARLERMLRLTATMAGLPALLVLGVYVLAGRPLLELVYPEAYGQGALVLALLSVGKLIRVATGSGSLTLIMTGYQNQLMRITLVCALLTVGSAVLLVQRFGGVGVAGSVAAGVIVQSVSVWLAAKHYTGMWTHVALPRPRELRELLRF
jgi:O-antigen/teichoic acid export membrane protein